MTMRQDRDTASWPERPWIMAALCAGGGFLFQALADHPAPTPSGAFPVWREAAATFVAVATIAFVITVEKPRWRWSLAFAAAWGLVVAMVGWFTASYNYKPEIFEFPFLSGLFAVLLAAPLFQTVRDEGQWRFPYVKLHGHAWTDAVIGAVSLGFVGVTFLLAFLIAGLFDLIGIGLIKDLLDESWFGWTLAGFAFGSAVGLLRERDGLVATLQRLAMVVLGVLAPVLAAALAFFLLSIPFTGLEGLWNSQIPATPMMLLAAAGSVLLVNAVIGNGRDDQPASRVLRWSALVLLVVVLPLALIAATSIGARIGQYGWTPERIWGVVAVGVAIAYGIAGWWAVYRGRTRFDDVLRPLQTRMAIGLCGLALLLALPIVDFGAISASSQLARLNAGKVEPAEFDWQAMAFDFGPSGRRALERIVASGAPDRQPLARTALATKSRYQVEMAVKREQASAGLEQTLRRIPEDIELTPELRRTIANRSGCGNGQRCVLVRIDEQRLALLTGHEDRGAVGSQIIDLRQLDPASGEAEVAPAVQGPPTPEVEDLMRAQIEVRTIQKRQLFVDGEPVGEPFE